MSLNEEYPIETEESFFAGVLKIIFIFGTSFLLSSFFVADQVWKPMKMTKKQIEEFIKEREEEEKNKEIPYEKMYELSDDSDIEIVDDESESESEEESEVDCEEDDEVECEEENVEDREAEGEGEITDNTSQEKESEKSNSLNETTDEDISSGELIERLSGDEGEVNEEDEGSNSEEVSEEEASEEDENENEDVCDKVTMNEVTEKIVDCIIEKAVTEIKQTHEECANENIKNLVKKPRRKITREQWNSRVEGLITKKIIEETPLGKVLMYYDSKNETFCYHGKKNVPYNYLETVARKYVRMYDCRPLYVDSQKELKQAREEERKKQEKEQEEMEQEKMKAEEDDKSVTKSSSENDVFANFKNYKKQTEAPTNSQMKSAKLSCSDSDIARVKEEVGSQQNMFSNNFTKTQKNSKNKKLTPLRSNRFTYKGTIDSIKVVKHKKKQLKINFATFKK